MPDAIEVSVRPLVEADLDQADRIFRVAFGTFLGAPDPERFFGDTEFIRTRWAADPGAAVGAEIDGELVGSNFATNWGSVGFFGPLTVAPAQWDRGIAHHLLDATMDIFTGWETGHAGLFTFARGHLLRQVRRRAGRCRRGRRLDQLIDACHALAPDRDASVVAGANGGRDRAWRALTGRGFRPQMQGVAMHRPNEPGYCTSDVYVIDDWR